jgi:DNA modification methylase
MTPYYADRMLTILAGDCREVMAQMEPESVQCVVTSPPYLGLRDYGIEPSVWGGEAHEHEWGAAVVSHAAGTRKDVKQGQFCPCGAWLGVLGLEPTLELYVAHMTEVFAAVRRVLRKDGCVWLNLGDSYCANGSGQVPQTKSHKGSGFSGPNRLPQPGLKPKDRMMVPARVALALQADGWWIRDEVVWAKPNPMPSSVTDRTTPAHEMVYLLTKSARYFYDAEAVREPAEYGRREWSNVEAVMASATMAGDTRPDHGVRVKSSVTGGDPSAGRNKRSVWTIATAPYGNFKMPVQGEHDGDDGSGRTTSPDCPVHGDLSRQDSTAGRDGQPGASGLDHTPRNGRRHEQVPLFGLAPIEQLPDADSGLDSLGSLLPECGAPATPHSTQSHRTDLAPETSPRETDAVGSSDRTGRTSPDAETDASGDHSPESRTEAGSAEGDRRPSSPAETPDRNACTCTSWVSVSHFAVFPPKLIEPMILAGTSERGCCPECGAPWAREVARTPMVVRPSARIAARRLADSVNDARTATSGTMTQAPTVETTGWRPTCKCQEACGCEGCFDGACLGPMPFDPVPCVVLDPFGGSGTVGMVSRALGRRSILIDLNSGYLRQMLKRATVEWDNHEPEPAADSPAPDDSLWRMA